MQQQQQQIRPNIVMPQQQQHFINIQSNGNIIQQHQPQYIQTQIQSNQGNIQQQQQQQNIIITNSNMRVQGIVQQQPQSIQMQQINQMQMQGGNMQTQQQSHQLNRQVHMISQQPQQQQQQPQQYVNVQQSGGVVNANMMQQQTLSPQGMMNTGQMVVDNSQDEIYNRKVAELRANHLQRLEKVMATAQSNKKITKNFFSSMG